MAVRITTLGTLRIELDGHVLDRLPAARNRCALLVHLAVEREITRDAAMGLLWPDRPPARARHLLSQTLYELRQELGEDWVEAVGERLRATDALRIDAIEMVAAVEGGEHDRAVALYGGPFLPGAALAVSRPMEGWIDGQQAALTRLHRRARRGAIDARVADGRLADALGLARSWAELDPLDDEAQHRLIELLAATGDRSGALRQYERYAVLVERELELEPLDETRELVERIREGEVGERTASKVVEGTASKVAEPRAVYAASGSSGPASVATAPPSAAERRREPAPAGAPDPRSQEGDAVPESFLDRVAGLRHRRSVQWTLAYLAGSVVLLEGLDILTDYFGLPPLVLRSLALLLALGAIAVLGAGWYLADQRRRFGRPEMALTLLVGTFVLSLPVWFARATPAPANGERPSANRLAVLYFDDMSADGSLTHLASGFTEALIHELSQVEGLDVLSRRAVEPFRSNTSVGYDSIVRALHAGLLVEGSVTQIGDRLRLTIQLIEGRTASHLMSTTLDSPMDSVDRLLVAMPDEAARLLRRRLGDWVELRQMETAASSAKALELVQRAQPLIEDADQVGRSDLQASLPMLTRADSMLREAERVDPNWPAPTLLRAEVAEVRALTTADVPSQYEATATEEALSHLDRVLQQWPEYPPALARRGNLYFGLAQSGHADEDNPAELYRRAEADLRRAVLLDERLTEGWWALSKLLLHRHAYAEARRAAVRAVETDSFLTGDIGNLWHLFLVSFDAEDHPAALHWCDEIERQHPDQQHWAYCELILLTSSPIVNPDVDRAWRMAAAIVERGGESDRAMFRDYSAVQVSKVLVRAGLPDSARSVIRRTLPEPLPDWASYDVAHLHLLLGEEEKALEVLEQWVEWNPARASRLGRDWWFRQLHGHPEFEKLLGLGPG